jgi:hypothetical protein
VPVFQRGVHETRVLYLLDQISVFEIRISGRTMIDFRIGQRVTAGSRRGTVVGTRDDDVHVVWDDGRTSSIKAANLRMIGRAP